MRAVGLLICAASLFGGVEDEIAELGGEAVRATDGAIVYVSLARTNATDSIVGRIATIKTLRRLDLSFTYVTDQGIERLQQLPQLEELTLDTAEFITDAATSYLRANKTLRKLVLRGTDITDVSLPYLAELTNLRSLDISQSMLGDVGLESLPALTQLEELDLGGTRISGINLNFLKLLPKLRKLSLRGIQRRNAGACWTPTITDLDLEIVGSLTQLEELDLGIGLSLGRTGVPKGAGNCRVTGGIQITDLGLAKLANLKKLRRLNVSGAKVTAVGLRSLQGLPLERLDLWNCQKLDDSAVPVLTSMPKLEFLDIADTSIRSISAPPHLKTVLQGNVTP